MSTQQIIQSWENGAEPYKIKVRNPDPTQPKHTQGTYNPRPIGSLRGTIAGAWNLDFTAQRRSNIKRLIRQRLRATPNGKGNKAWKRVDQLDRDPSAIVWPTYCFPSLLVSEENKRMRTHKPFRR